MKRVSIELPTDLESGISGIQLNGESQSQAAQRMLREGLALDVHRSDLSDGAEIIGRNPDGNETFIADNLTVAEYRPLK